MRRLARLMSVAACPVLLPAAAYAQASVAGQVRDTSGAVLPGVTVEASSPALIEKVRTAVTDGTGRQTSTWAIERAVRSARPKVAGLPEAFRFHDLRHYLASLLIGSGLDVKVVQHRLRHGSAKTTLDTYGHLWPDSD